MVPEDHRATIEFPKSIRSGPVELIVLVPSENEAEEKAEALPASRGRIKALATEFARDPRSFRELSPEERTVRLERVMGVGRGLMSTSDEIAKRKIEESDLEDRKFAH